MNGANKYTVHTRLAMLENAVTELKKENAELRTHLKGALQTAVNDAANTIQSAQAADFRELQEAFGERFTDLQASIHQGVDGKDGATGPAGPKGDVLIPNETELQQAVIALRIKLKQRHAAQIAPIVERLQYEKSQDAWVHRHFTMLLEGILRDIEMLQRVP
jgi:hypothetical protein